MTQIESENELGAPRTLAIFWFCNLLAGVAFVFFLSPLVALDEGLHWLRTAQIADGGIFPEKYGPNTWGGPLSREVTDFFAFMMIKIVGQQPATFHDAWELAESLKAVSAQKSVMWFPSSAAYAPLPYIPSAIGIDIARALGGNVLVQLWAGRLANLVTYFVLLLAIVKMLPYGRVATLALATTPGILRHAMAIHADPMNFALPILLCAIVLRLRAGLPVNQWKIAVAALIAALGMLRPTYLLFAAVAFLIPARLFGGTAAKLLYLAIPTAVAGAIFLYWSLSYPFDPGLYWRPGETNPMQAITVIAGDLRSAADALLRTFNEFKVDWTTDYFTRFSGHRDPYAFNGPETFSWIGFGLIGALVLVDGTRQRDPRAAILLLLLAAALTAAIILVFWITFTKPGANRIEGIQGRYFHTMITLAILAISAVIPAFKQASFIQASWASVVLLWSLLCCNMIVVALVVAHFQQVWIY